MKTHAIEVQRIKAASNSHGLITARVDVLLQPTTRHDDVDSEPGSTLSLSIENARVLFLLLKAQLAQVDAKKARSQR